LGKAFPNLCGATECKRQLRVAQSRGPVVARQVKGVGRNAGAPAEETGDEQWHEPPCQAAESVAFPGPERTE